MDKRQMLGIFERFLCHSPLKMDSLQMAERGRPEVINAENVAMPCIREIADGNNNFGDSETLLRTEDRTNGTDDTAAAKRRKRKKIPAGRREERREVRYTGREANSPAIIRGRRRGANENAKRQFAETFIAPSLSLSFPKSAARFREKLHVLRGRSQARRQ